ncbi:MAG: hypothetical protein NW215_15320 [Hyphomicrobiales bacterium]|nr:hypothetical protein [Hyphomicrobiales bacterium]
MTQATLRAALAAALLISAAAPARADLSGSDYSTAVKVEYVFGCMESAGQTRDALERCSCSIDVIASILPYERYVEAETIISVGLAGGERTAMMKSDPSLREKVAEMRRAQAEAEIRCF